ncbi:hypothetical protein [Thiocapsa imhoffii]|uniref:hypothetical protein n=1 Tax=Thiocapsa imhoffii TaxID=382777 RepID=UPI001906F149|nr:hypothetical protein [Thiocapsa imhoffii]
MIRFLRILSALLGRSSLRDSQRHQYISPTGSVARFVFEKRKFFADGHPKPHVFEPMKNKQTGVFETSVCGLNEMAHERLWFIGAHIRDKPALAAVEIAVAEVNRAGLCCEPDPCTAPIDFPEHGLILGWHESEKSRRIEKMQSLAAACKATHRPSSSCDDVDLPDV